ncbi:MAG: tetratricopeptide repeat protein [Vicinamibacterales bacterium]
MPATALAVALVAQAMGQGRADIVLVVPFELDRFDARTGWLSEGAAVGVTDALAARGVAVVDRNARLAVLERLQLPPGAMLTRATLIKVAALVGATRAVFGEVSERDGVVTIAPRVLDVSAASLTDLAPAATPATALLDAFDRVAAALAGPGRVTRPARGALPVTAFERYVRGLVAPSSAAGERLLRQALDEAPTYSAAREALWDAQTTRGAHAAALATAGGVDGGSVPGGRTPGWRVRAAASLVQLRRYDEAFELLSALTVPSTDALVPSFLGVIQIRRGATPQSGRATYFFNQAADRAPASADACFNLGYAYWLDKDPLAAAYWLREAVRRNPADGDAHFVLAAALATTGAGAEADRERELARRLSERWEAAAPGDLVPRGLERLPDPDRPAPDVLESAITADADRDQRAQAAFHVGAARRAYDAGRDPEAIRELQRALYLTPYDADALLLLGRAQARSGLVQDAIGSLKIAVWSDEPAEAHLALGEAYLRAHDSAAALRAAERALALEPSNAAAADLAARAKAPPGGA